MSFPYEDCPTPATCKESISINANGPSYIFFMSSNVEQFSEMHFLKLGLMELNKHKINSYEIS